MVEARNHLKSISLAYHRSPSQPLKIQLLSAKKNLDDAYLNAEVYFINGKIKVIGSGAGLKIVNFNEKLTSRSKYSNY